VLSDINENLLKETEKELQDKGIPVTSYVADVAKLEEQEALVKHAVDTFGSVDVFINNAGIEGVIDPVTEIDPQALDLILDINVKGVFYGTSVAAKQMIKQGNGGRIINACSIAGKKGTAMMG